MTDTNECLEKAGQVLWRSAVLGIAFLIFWAVLFLRARGLLEAQGRWFGLSPHEVALIHYCGMGFVKGSILVFFLCPYLAIRIVLRKRGNRKPNDIP